MSHAPLIAKLVAGMGDELVADISCGRDKQPCGHPAREHREIVVTLLHACLDSSTQDVLLTSFFTAMGDELILAEETWPNNDINVRIHAVTGELGELAQGYLKGRPTEALIREAVQVATTAYRVAKVLGMKSYTHVEP